MDRVHTFIAGCGYVGEALAAVLLAEGKTVVAARRRPERLAPELLAAGAIPMALDLGAPEEYDLPAAELLVLAASPDGRTQSAYFEAFGAGPSGLLEELARRGLIPKRAVLVSSTGAFAEAKGGWVDELSPPNLDDPVQGAIVRGERAFTDAAARTGVRPIVARFAGIYGPGRERLIAEVLEGRATYDGAHDGWTNRIHVHDGARAIAHIAALADPEFLWAIVDREPARRRDVLAHLAARLDAARPVAAPTLAATDKSERGEKRVSSARLAASGFVFRYPTYREGYGALLAARGLVR